MYGLAGFIFASLIFVPAFVRAQDVAPPVAQTSNLSAESVNNNNNNTEEHLDMYHVAWTKVAREFDLQGSFPVPAIRSHQSGQSKIRCHFQESGNLSKCVILSENPNGYDFGRAAIYCARFYKVRPGAYSSDRTVDLSFSWIYTEPPVQ